MGSRLIQKQMRVCNTVKTMKRYAELQKLQISESNGHGFNLCVAPLLKNRVPVISEVAEKDLER